MPNANPPDGKGDSSPVGRRSEDEANDPVKFVTEVLGESPYDKQIEIMQAVAGSRRVSVVGCNGSGKDWAAARAVLWWMHSRSPAKAIVTGPTTRQVDAIVWNEMRVAHSRAEDVLGGHMYKEPRYQIDDENFALGFASNSPHNVLGFHSPNMLVVITEAHAVGGEYIDALRRLNPTRLLMTGNPFTASGTFYDSHHSRRNLYKTIEISAFDTPNIKAQKVVVPGMITQQDIDDRKGDWGEDSPQYIGSILARFPDNLDGIIVPLSSAKEAADRKSEAEGPIVVACDVARFGQDKTVVIRRQGLVARIVWRVKGHDTMQIADFLKNYCETNPVDSLVVDDTGIGGGVVDRLKQLGLRSAELVPFIAARRAEADAYFENWLAETWWIMREYYLYRGLDTDNDEALMSQVSSREYEITPRARIRLQSKEKMHNSPDEADALAMTFAVVRKGIDANRGGVKIWV